MKIEMTKDYQQLKKGEVYDLAPTAAAHVIEQGAAKDLTPAAEPVKEAKTETSKPKTTKKPKTANK